MAIKYVPEPFRIKVVEPIKMLTREERRKNRQSELQPFQSEKRRCLHRFAHRLRNQRYEP